MKIKRTCPQSTRESVRSADSNVVFVYTYLTSEILI